MITLYDYRPFLVGDRYSLADIALYAYTHVAPEGGVALDAYPNIRAWIGRIAEQPGWAPITSA
jgi:glutathione S-transferase